MERMSHKGVQLSNIKLDYPVSIQDWPTTDNIYFCPAGAEFFLDEHGNQWVKFVPTNGYQRNMEHMVRTETVIVVRRDAE